MSENRKYRTGENVYVIDYDWNSVIVRKGIILSVSEIDNTAEIFLREGMITNRYSLSDAGRLIFDSKEKAESALRKFPGAGTTIFLLIGSKIQKSKITQLTSKHYNGVFDIVYRIYKRKPIRSIETGKTIFLKKDEAIKAKSKKNSNPKRG